MNILDIFEAPPEVPDKLDEIFRRQLELERKYDEIERGNGFDFPDWPVDINDPKAQLRVKEIAYRCVEELSEATNCLKNKPWKTTHVVTDEMHFLEELSDAFHFFLELCLVLGIGPQELYTLYHRKNKVNQFRQETKY